MNITCLPSVSDAPVMMLQWLFAGPCAKNGTCIDANSGLNLTTSAETCSNATGYCAPTGVYSVCTAQCGGSCVPTNTNYTLCGRHLRYLHFSSAVLYHASGVILQERV